MSGKKNQDKFTKLVISESHLLFKWDLFFKIFKNFSWKSGRQKISSDMCGKFFKSNSYGKIRWLCPLFYYKKHTCIQVCPRIRAGNNFHLLKWRQIPFDSPPLILSTLALMHQGQNEGSLRSYWNETFALKQGNITLPGNLPK